VDRYVFISTVSVYADNSEPGHDENAPLEKYTGADPMKETLKSVADSKYALYGPLKALSEQEAEKWFPGQTLIIRPGLIVGPGDESDRFTYWPVRLDRGGKVLAPGATGDPVQFIDARDLAEWTIRMAEAKQTGVYTATGPAPKLTMGGMLDGIQKGIGSKAELVWVNADFLKAQKVSEWSDMPVWVPPVGEMKGFASLNIQRALQGPTDCAPSDLAGGVEGGTGSGGARDLGEPAKMKVSSRHRRWDPSSSIFPCGRRAGEHGRPPPLPGGFSRRAAAARAAGATASSFPGRGWKTP
jgi:hypothetical protein